jgi:hypothetical protein
MNDGSNKFRRPASLTGSRSENAQVETPAAATRTIVLVNELNGVFGGLLGRGGYRIRKAIDVTSWSAQWSVGDVREKARGATDQ